MPAVIGTFRTVATVMGHRLPPPRLTGWAVAYGLAYIGGPVLLAAGLLDLIGYAVFRFGLDRCYGLLCLMGG